MADWVTATDVAPRTRLMLEILVVVMIVAYLITFTISRNDLLVARTQSFEAFTVWLPVRADLMAFRAERGQWPTTVDEVSADALIDDRVTAVARIVELGEGGTLTVVFGDEKPTERLRGRRLTFRPALSTTNPGAPVIWFCGSHPVPEGFAPGGQDLSDVAPEYLPVSCRDFPR